MQSNAKCDVCRSLGIEAGVLSGERDFDCLMTEQLTRAS